jgi:hypothetical protein
MLLRALKSSIVYPHQSHVIEPAINGPSRVVEDCGHVARGGRGDPEAGSRERSSSAACTTFAERPACFCGLRPGPSEVGAFIDGHREHFGVQPVCPSFGVWAPDDERIDVGREHPLGEVEPLASVRPEVGHCLVLLGGLDAFRDGGDADAVRHLHDRADDHLTGGVRPCGSGHRKRDLPGGDLLARGRGSGAPPRGRSRR